MQLIGDTHKTSCSRVQFRTKFRQIDAHSFFTMNNPHTREHTVMGFELAMFEMFHVDV